MPTFEFKAMGTTIEVIIFREESEQLVRDHFEEYEQRFSRFRDKSELSQLNQERSLQVSDDFLNLMALAKKMHTKTKAAFNPLLSVSRIGYSDSYEKPEVTENPEYNTDFAAIKIEGNMITLQPGQNLDLGGIAKGWTVDQLVKKLRELDHENFMINAGGDLYASGTKEGESWKVGLDHSGKVFEPENQAIATSSAQKRHWEINGKAHHHIVNHESFDSAENDLYSITVLGDKLAECDAWATAAYSLGRTKGQELLIKNNIEYFLCLS
jgi:FAD:protein FMN transferase